MTAYESTLFGTVVKSVSGRDRKRVFIVVGEEDGDLLVVNGSLRSTASPKRKNIRHVKPIGHLTEAECERLRLSLTDETAVDILKSYDLYVCRADLD